MDNWDECISLWSASLSRGGIKPKRTCEEYKRYLIEFLNRPGLQSDPGLVTEARVTEYCFSVDHKGLMPSRGLISMRIASLKNFYKFDKYILLFPFKNSLILIVLIGLLTTKPAAPS